jgi:hypothetical protein
VFGVAVGSLAAAAIADALVSRPNIVRSATAYWEANAAVPGDAVTEGICGAVPGSLKQLVAWLAPLASAEPRPATAIAMAAKLTQLLGSAIYSSARLASLGVGSPTECSRALHRDARGLGARSCCPELGSARLPHRLR